MHPRRYQPWRTSRRRRARPSTNAPGKNCLTKLSGWPPGRSAAISAFRQIHFEFAGKALAIKYSDGGAADPLVEVFDIKPGETAEAALQRLFLEKTDKAVSARCVLAPYTEGTVPAGVKRYTFSPDAAYAKELKALASSDEIPEPPCGDWGEMPDGMQYFEVPAGEGHSLLFVRIGQDEPLFDEQTLRVLPRG
ncbi:hypothetical protein [Mesorhizobium sp. WSM1293]|uniref:hypothetical protein n=1 Tax=Mesorhizobium sp. WSM1293 TaxID=1040984 RepID=UPI0004B75180|nr:hypothetical protein [Mesorhizobium sp. WSM1293]